MKDNLGDTMKALEAASAPRVIPYSRPVYVRVDGRSFSKFTQRWRNITVSGAYLHDIKCAMQFATEFVVMHLHADVGYCQSDEASFGWFAHENPLSQHPFNGKIQKLESVVASMFTLAFVQRLQLFRPHTMKSVWQMITFDGRAVDMVDHENLQKMFFWRYLDAKRNSVNMFARQFYSQKELHGVKNKEVLDMINAVPDLAVEWSELNPFYREGSFYVRKGIKVDHATFVAAFNKE